MKGKRIAKGDAQNLAERLTRSAVSIAPTDLKTAQARAAIARRVMLKFNVRLGPALKRYTCRGCKRFIVPGVNARVRLGSGKQKVLRITCDECGRVNRKILGTP